MQEFLQQFFQRDAGAIVQFLKYMIAGGIATMVDASSFYLLSWKLFPALKEDDPILKIIPIPVTHIDEKKRSCNFVTNTIIAFMFANTVCYIVNVLWVFQPGRRPWYIEMLLFYAVSAVAVAVGTFLGWAMIKHLHLSTTLSYLAKMFAGLMINYVSRKLIIFKG